MLKEENKLEKQFDHDFFKKNKKKKDFSDLPTLIYLDMSLETHIFFFGLSDLGVWGATKHDTMHFYNNKDNDMTASLECMMSWSERLVAPNWRHLRTAPSSSLSVFNLIIDTKD